MGASTRDRWDGSLPKPRQSPLAAARALDNHNGEQDLRQPEAEPADGRHHIQSVNCTA